MQLKWYVVLLMRQYIFSLGVAAILPFVRFGRFRGPWFKWWSVCLLSFIMLSVIFMIGANPKLDVQDSFIQRLKFIPSFAIWAIFMGLGPAGVGRTKVSPS